MKEKKGTWHVRDEYQFAATMGLDLRFSFLDFGFCFTFGLEERFFFFWSSRPIFGVRIGCESQVEVPVTS